MKKEIRGIICLLWAMVMVASCSDNSKMKGLLEQVPADADVVFVGNVKTVLESAGGALDSKPSVNPVLRVFSKMSEMFSKSCRILQDSWTYSKNLGRMSEDSLLLETVRKKFQQVA